MLTIGIDLGGTNIKAALVDSKTGIRYKTTIPTQADQGVNHVIARIAEAVGMAVAKADAPVDGVGIGSPGVISFDRTTVSHPPNFPGWITVNLAAEIKTRTGLECYVDNDANLMALGSAKFGVGRAFPSFIMVTLGTGVGGGIIHQGRLFRGVTGGAGELGHVMIDYNGPSSLSPARGGIEAYLGQRFLSRLAWLEIEKHPDNGLYQSFRHNPDKLEPKDLSLAADAGNRLALDILASAGEKLGYAIVNYIHVLDIRKIVVSGGVSAAGERLLGPARQAALSRMLEPYKTDFEIIREDLGNDAAALGAASLPYEYQDP